MNVLDLEELRNRGFTEDDFTDKELLKAEENVWELIKLFTNREFDVQNFTLDLDGSGGYILKLPLPVSPDGVTSVTIDSYGSLDMDNVVVYNREVPDDTDYPKISWTSAEFPQGYQNVHITGYFGEVPPAPLQEAAMRMMYIMFEPLLEGGEQGPSVPKTDIKSELTDRYQYTKFDRNSIPGLFDEFVTGILSMYSVGDDIVYGSWV